MIAARARLPAIAAELNQLCRIVAAALVLFALWLPGAMPDVSRPLAASSALAALCTAHGPDAQPADDDPEPTPLRMALCRAACLGTPAQAALLPPPPTVAPAMVQALAVAPASSAIAAPDRQAATAGFRSRAPPTA